MGIYYYINKRGREAVEKIRAAGCRNSEMAKRLGAHPSWTSSLVSGSRPARKADQRVQRFLRLIGLEFDEAFERAQIVDEAFHAPETEA